MMVDLKLPRNYSVNDGITLELAVAPYASADDEVDSIL